MQRFIFIGANSDMAIATANQFKQQGIEVIGLSRSECTSEYSHSHIISGLSESDFPQLEGQIDGLVYFPGSVNLKSFRSLKEEELITEYQINVLGALNAVKIYLPNLKLSKQASVVFFSSVAVQLGMPFHASVGMNKGAVEGLVRSLAAELSPEIRVNAIALSLTETKMTQRMVNTGDKRLAIAQRHPLNAIGTLDDVTHMLEFLLTTKSAWMTGQILHLDGGMSAVKK
jgi:NAD(P)-dependent dehydrogenase (short-subunit alcohol dehydrogenase family)